MASRHVKVVEFGPGSLESIQLRLWTRAGSKAYGRAQKVAEARGTFVVYAPSGEYTVAIKERIEAHESERSFDPQAELIWAAAEGDGHAARELTGELVEWALEDWTDPVDVDV